MRIARIRKDDMATPVLAIACDGAYYDVGELEALWFPTQPYRGSDFFTRAIGTRCAGLNDIFERLRSGFRPTEARCQPGEFLALAPCATERVAYIQMGPWNEGSAGPMFQQRDSRGLLGDGQSVPFPAFATRPYLQAGFAVILAEDLQHAGPAEAEKAILGYTLLIDWTAEEQRWRAALTGPDAPGQLGPELVLAGPASDEFLRQPLQLTIGERSYQLSSLSAARFSPSEMVAFLSQHRSLHAGDVIGLGDGAAGTEPYPLAFGESATLSLGNQMTLSGSAVVGRKPADWSR